MDTRPTRRLALLALPSTLLIALGAGAAAPALRGTVWQLGADGPNAPHIRLDETEPRLSGFNGCNRLVGRFELDGARLRIEVLGSSRRACPQEDGAEDRFLAALSAVSGWRIEGGRLKLLSAGGGTVLDLRPGKAVP